MTGLNEALEDAKSEAHILKRNKVSVEPAMVFKADEVKKIRNSTGGLKGFLLAIWVANKTVEVWESGTNHPSGATSRILSMLEKDRDLIIKFPFVSYN